MSVLLHRELPAPTLVVAIDPGKVANRVWLTSGERGLIGEPHSLSVLRDGVDELEGLIASSGIEGEPVIGIEATGSGPAPRTPRNSTPTVLVSGVLDRPERQHGS